MPGDTRGTDLVSWWRNRDAYRKGTSQVVRQLQEAAERWADIAGGAFEAAAVPKQAPEELIRHGDSLLAALQEADKKLPQFANAMQSAEAKLRNVQGAVEQASQQRTRLRAEMEAQNATQARRRWSQRRQNLRKLMALAVFAIVIFLIVRF